MARVCGEKLRWKWQRYHDDFKGSSGCAKIVIDGIKGPSQVCPSCQTPFSSSGEGLHHCHFFMLSFSYSPLTGTLLVWLSGNWAVKLQRENAGSPQMCLMGGSSTYTPLLSLFLVSILFFLSSFFPSLTLFLRFLLCCFLQGHIPTVTSKSLFGN